MCYTLPGPRCSSHARKSLQKAQDNYAKNPTDANKKRLEKAQADYNATPDGITELEQAGRTQDAVEATIDRNNRLVAYKEKFNAEPNHAEPEPDVEERIARAEKAIDERINSPEFIEMLDRRDHYRAEKERLLAEAKDLEEAVKKGEAEFSELREKNFEFRAASVELLVVNDQIDKYKDKTAEYAVELSELRENFDRDYDGETHLGVDDVCVKKATYDSGTREWLEERQFGIGGSDIGSILKLDKKYGAANYKEWVESKVNPISDDQVELQTVTNKFSGATGRGNAWEPLIVAKFKEEHPEYETVFSKSTWRSTEDERQVINVDGLLADEPGGPVNGILEIKTASDASKWEKDVPMGYRAQVLWYLDATKYDYAHIAVSIDDREYRSYRINRGETIEGKWAENGEGRTIDDVRPTIDAEWEKVQALRKKKAEDDKKRAEAEAKGETIEEPKPKSLKAKFPAETKKTREAFEKNIARASAYRQETPAETRATFERFRNTGLDDHEAMVATYQSFDLAKAKKDIVFLDLETDAGTSRDGDIIELGAVRCGPDGTVKESFSQLYGVSDERTLAVRGTGVEDVHHISPDMIRGKKPFSDPENQRKVREFIGDGVLSHHNSPFENSWLGQHLDGHKDERGQTKPDIDTMYIAKHMDEKGTRNTLEDFVTARGMKYEGAHRAHQDAEMSANAFFAWHKEKKTEGWGI